MSKSKPPSGDFTVAEVKRLLLATRAYARTADAQSQATWEPLIAKLQRLIGATTHNTTFSASKAMCTCGHALSSHYAGPGDCKHPCLNGVFTDGISCDCRAFQAAGHADAP